MTKGRWHYEWRELYEKLSRRHPSKSPRWRFDEAHRIMRARRGPEPPGPFSVVLKTLFGYLKRRGDMNWDWTKTLWKALRGALGAALAVAVLSVLGAFDTEAELLTAGVPKWLAPIAVMGVAFVVSWIRNWITINRPRWNLVKKAGAKIQPALKG